MGYLFLTIGELLISPIGQSMVGKLAPLGQEGLMMGIWQTFVGFSAAFADRFADMADIPSKATYEQGSHVYFHAFITITLVTFLLALASWSLVPVIKKAIVSDYSDRV